MATVQVSTLAEFITAIAVSGDTVVCPEGAVWDANDVYPDGYPGDIDWKAHVQGNGTEIKNFRIYGLFKTEEYASRVKISNLRIIDLIGSMGGRGTTGVEYGIFWGSYEFEDFVFTGVVNSSYNLFCLPRDYYYMYQPKVTRCSFNIDASGEFRAFDSGGSGSDAGKVRYSRIELHLPNSHGRPFGWTMPFDNCELIAYAPNTTAAMYSMNYIGCVIHGDMPSLQEGSSSGRWEGDMTVYSTDAMPSFVPYDAAHFVGVTDAQLRDPVYLRGIGFPVAIDV